MSYTIELTAQAEQHLIEWQKSGQVKTLRKIISLFEELKEHPTPAQDKSSSLKVITQAFGADV